MSGFDSLYAEGEATDYASDGEPVPQEEIDTIQDNITQVMGDNVLNTGGENLASENVGEPLPPNPPMEPVGQNGPMETPTNQFMDNTSDPLDTFMEAHSEDFRDVSSMKLADYEEWLFKSESEAGEIAVARIVSNFKASGYDVKPTYAAVAGATWSRMNYAGEEHTEALKNVERASVADLQPLVVEIESEGITSLIETVRKAESQADDFRAEMITQIKEELASEEMEQKAADNTLESENWINRVKDHSGAIGITIATLIGIGVLSKWK
ncbi:MAG: hypothetical protein GY751_11500 [Bacteroidetes bacterium]|nr:hypothetical protein [Bacteroidota bacterium]